MVRFVTESFFETVSHVEGKAPPVAVTVWLRCGAYDNKHDDGIKQINRDLSI
jgi:hypothetical protein